jgi:hypothetical protein
MPCDSPACRGPSRDDLPPCFDGRLSSVPSQSPHPIIDIGGKPPSETEIAANLCASPLSQALTGQKCLKRSGFLTQLERNSAHFINLNLIICRRFIEGWTTGFEPATAWTTNGEPRFADFILQIGHLQGFSDLDSTSLSHVEVRGYAGISGDSGTSRQKVPEAARHFQLGSYGRSWLGPTSLGHTRRLLGMRPRRTARAPSVIPGSALRAKRERTGEPTRELWFGHSHLRGSMSPARIELTPLAVENGNV